MLCEIRTKRKMKPFKMRNSFVKFLEKRNIPYTLGMLTRPREANYLDPETWVLVIADSGDAALEFALWNKLILIVFSTLKSYGMPYLSSDNDAKSRIRKWNNVEEIQIHIEQLAAN